MILPVDAILLKGIVFPLKSNAIISLLDCFSATNLHSIPALFKNISKSETFLCSIISSSIDCEPISKPKYIF